MGGDVAFSIGGTGNLSRWRLSTGGVVMILLDVMQFLCVLSIDFLHSSTLTA